MLLCYLRHTCIYLCFSVYRATHEINLETIYTGWLLSQAPPVYNTTVYRNHMSVQIKTRETDRPGKTRDGELWISVPIWQVSAHNRMLGLILRSY